MTSSRYEVVSECDGCNSEENQFLAFAREAAVLLPEGGLIITQHGDPESEEYWVEEEWLEDLIRREGELWDFLCNHYSERLHKDGYHYAWRNDTGGLGFVIYR